MTRWGSMINKNKAIIGMIHVRALPGTPKSMYSIDEICEIAVSEATLYQEAGIDGIILENMHDVPYLNREVGPEIVASMAVVAKAVRETVDLPLGVQILAGANKAALSVAKAANLDFIRAEGFIFSHIADEGLMNSDAGELLRFRKLIDAEDIAIFTDIKKKHGAHKITEDIAIDDMAKAAEFFLSDGVIVTGESTGKEPNINDLKRINGKVGIPALIGSGINEENIEKFWETANGFIIGSSFKENGYWENDICDHRVKEFMQIVKRLRKEK